MSENRENRLVNWYKNNKLLIYIVALLFLALAAVEISFIGSSALFGLLFNLFLVAMLIWFGYTSKTGGFIIIFGLFNIMTAVISWLTIFTSPGEYSAVFFYIAAVISTIISAVLIYFGIKRFRS
jgi:uncharacterized membrane protein